MKSHFGLSEMEYELMQVFWELDKPLTFPQVVEYCNNQKGHRWAKTTIHTFLTRMVGKEVLKVENGRKKHVYTPLFTKEELASRAVNRFIEETFDGCPKALMKAFTKAVRLTGDDVIEMKQMLDACSIAGQ